MSMFCIGNCLTLFKRSAYDENGAYFTTQWRVVTGYVLAVCFTETSAREDQTMYANPETKCHLHLSRHC